MSWFVALPVRLGDWFDVLAPPPTLKREHRADLHLTIAFFGNIAEDRARAAFAAVSVADPVPASSVPLTRLDPLGPRRRPSVIAAILDSADLAAFMGKHRDAFWDAAAVARDERPPLPHVTVARFAGSADRTAGLRWAEGRNVAGQIAEIGTLALYGPAPPGSGRRYTTALRG